MMLGCGIVGTGGDKQGEVCGATLAHHTIKDVRRHRVFSVGLMTVCVRDDEEPEVRFIHRRFTHEEGDIVVDKLIKENLAENRTNSGDQCSVLGGSHDNVAIEDNVDSGDFWCVVEDVGLLWLGDAAGRRRIYDDTKVCTALFGMSKCVSGIVEGIAAVTRSAALGQLLLAPEVDIICDHICAGNGGSSDSLDDAVDLEARNLPRPKFQHVNSALRMKSRISNLHSLKCLAAEMNAQLTRLI